LQDAVLCKKSPQPLILLNDFAGCPLHVLSCCNAFQLIFLNSSLKVLDQVLPSSPRASLVVANACGVIGLELTQLRCSKEIAIFALYGQS
jgi:hypothetical protein